MQNLSSLGWEELDDLYREVILDHYRNPRNQGDLDAPDLSAQGQNPFCGDEVTIQAKVEDGTISRVNIHGQGCSISQASLSMLSELLKGKSLEEASTLSRTFRQMMRGDELTEAEMEELGELAALAGVRNFPIRIKCALLSWVTLEDGIIAYHANT